MASVEMKNESRNEALSKSESVAIDVNDNDARPLKGDGTVSDKPASMAFVRRLSQIGDNMKLETSQTKVYLHKRQQTLSKLFKDGMQVEQDGMALFSLQVEQQQQQQGKATGLPDTPEDHVTEHVGPTDSETIDEAFKPSAIKHIIAALFIIVIFGGAFFFQFVQWNSGAADYYNMSYAALLGFMLLLFIYLNFVNKFYEFHEWFACLCNGKAPPLFVLCTLVFGLLQWIIWTLYENEFLEDSSAKSELLIIVDVAFYTALVFFFFSFMSYWSTISYYCSEKSWVQAFIYMSIIGYLLIWSCRQLRPPKSSNAWHRVHPIHQILASLCWILGVCFLLFVILTGVGLAIISEMVQIVSDEGSGWAIGGYVFISFCIMLAPLAPGSIVDVSGGFLLIYVFEANEGLTFWEAWGVSVAFVSCLHFCGACAQWYIGTWPCVQHYANLAFPAEMLAASDAVLEDANFLTVGIIGFVFMDTMNGLNQGRINMEFWTQLFSEWSCVPNAFALVSLGGTVAAPLTNNTAISKLLDVTVPLLTMIAVLVQFAGFTLGVRELGKSINTDEYMIAREKWASVQFFSDLGYVPSKEGWKHDVFQLAKPNSQYEEQNQSCLYESVLPLQRWLAQVSKTPMSSKQKLDCYGQYRNALSAIRNKHFTCIEIQYKELVEKKWLIEVEATDKPLPFFDLSILARNGKRRKLHVIVALILLFSFWACFSGIYWQIQIEEAVEEGFSVLNKIEALYWIPFVVFIVTYMFYSHVAILYGLKSLHKALKFCFFCCNIDPDIESRFESPNYETKEYQLDADFTPKCITDSAEEEHNNNDTKMKNGNNENNENNENNKDDGNENGNESDTDVGMDKDYDESSTNRHDKNNSMQMQMAQQIENNPSSQI